MIFVDTSFFYALFTEEDDNHQRAVEAFKELEGRRLFELLLTTNHIVFETITLTRMSFKRTGHERAVYVGERLFAEKLARIYRATAEDETAAFAYLQKYRDKEFSAVDCLSFVVMDKHGISEALTFDSRDFSHRFIVRPVRRAAPPRDGK